MTQKRLNIDLIEDLFVREELIRLYEENKQLKQFKEKVFTLIDKEIARNEEVIEVFIKPFGSDSGSMIYYNRMLKRLQKELSE